MESPVAQLQKYLYCIIRCREKRTFDAVAIGDAGSIAHTVSYESLAAVVSDSSVTKYETTRKNMMAHQTVIEKVMQDYTLLPVRFGTVTEADSATEAIRKLLRCRFQEFDSLLNEMEGKVELGLKALWRDEKTVFAEILADNREIQRARNSLSGKSPEVIHFAGVPLGRMVKNALENKKNQEATRILARLRRLADRVRENDTLINRMILNAALLVDERRVHELDKAMGELDKELGERIIFKYVGPTPPYNFVDIVVNWNELQ